MFLGVNNTNQIFCNYSPEDQKIYLNWVPVSILSTFGYPASSSKCCKHGYLVGY